MQLNVLRDSNSLLLGYISPVVGMYIVDNHKIVKVNSETIKVESVFGNTHLFDSASIWYSSAIAFGYPQIYSDDKEIESSHKRRFCEGEQLFKDAKRKGCDKPPIIDSDPFIREGWKFSQTVQNLRDLAIATLND